MASENLILELIRQAQQQRNQPSQAQQTISSLQQAIQGVAQGIQLFDLVKGVGAKYGSTVTTPGTPGVPAQAPTKSLRAASGFSTGGAPPTFNPASLMGGLKTEAFPTPARPSRVIDVGDGGLVPGAPEVPGVLPTTKYQPGILDIETFGKLAESLKNFTGPGVENVLSTEGERRGLPVGNGIRNVAELKSDTAKQLAILKDDKKAKVASEVVNEKSVANLNDRLKTTATAITNASKMMEKTQLFKNEPGFDTEYNRASMIYSQLLGEYEAITERLNKLQGLSIKSENSLSIPTDDTFWSQFSTP